MATANPNKNSIVMWQTAYEEQGLPEPALLIQSYRDNMIGITQEGREIIINTASINEFIKNVRKAAKLSEEIE